MCSSFFLNSYLFLLFFFANISYRPNVDIAIELSARNYGQVRVPAYVSCRTVLLPGVRVSYVAADYRFSEHASSVTCNQIVDRNISIRAASVNISLTCGFKRGELTPNQCLVNTMTFKSKNTLVIRMFRLSISHPV
jgi:hypothetical protein